VLPLLLSLVAQATPTEDALIRVSRRARAAVVHVEVIKGRTWAPPLQDLLQRFDVEISGDLPESEATGSAVIVSPDGRVLTNHHVVAGALAVQVILSDQRRFPARVIGTDPRTDLAVLRIEGGDAFPWLPLGDSDQVVVGQPVLAVGSPFDFQSTVTMGIVSATGRRGLDDAEIQDYLQTDAAVNPGNSGGPLVDLRGRVVGINTAIYSQGAEQNSGISFAIPANMARRVTDALERGDGVRRARIGLESVDADRVDGDASRRGAEVAWVVPASPAATAGLRRGDLVVSVDGEPVPTARALRDLVATRAVGRSVAIEVVRDGLSEFLDVEVADESTVGMGPDLDPLPGALDWAGLTAAPDTPSLRTAMGVPEGEGALVARVRPGSPAALLGVVAGDRIVALAGRPVEDLDDLRVRLEVLRPGQVMVGLARAGRRATTVLPVP
jgi:serine protease Do